jgi:hypothetical protein
MKNNDIVAVEIKKMQFVRTQLKIAVDAINAIDDGDKATAIPTDHFLMLLDAAGKFDAIRRGLQHRIDLVKALDAENAI